MGQQGFKSGKDWNGKSKGKVITSFRKRFYKAVEEKGLYDEAIKVLKESLANGKTRIDTAKWIIEQCQGRAPQGIMNVEDNEFIVKVVYGSKTDSPSASPAST